MSATPEPEHWPWWLPGPAWPPDLPELDLPELPGDADTLEALAEVRAREAEAFGQLRSTEGSPE